MQTPYIHIMAPPNQSPIPRPELARADIVQKERKSNQTKERKHLGHRSNHEKEKKKRLVKSAGATKTLDAYIGTNIKPTATTEATTGGDNQPLGNFRDTKLMKRECECYNQKGSSMSVRW